MPHAAIVMATALACYVLAQALVWRGAAVVALAAPPSLFGPIRLVPALVAVPVGFWRQTLVTTVGQFPGAWAAVAKLAAWRDRPPLG